MAADGEIRIVTKISTTEAKMQLRQLQSALASTGRDIERQRRNLAKLAPKLAEYAREEVWINANRDIDMAAAKTPSQRQATNEMYDIEYAKLDAKYADVLQLQQYYNANLDAAVQRQAELTTRVAEAREEHTRLVTAAEEAAAAKREQVAAEKQAAKEARETAKAEAKLSREAERAQRNMARSANNIARSMLKWGTAMLGVRGVIGILRKSVSAFLSDNESVANQLVAIWSAIGNALGPIITRIIGLIQTLFAAISAFVKALTGVDMIANYNAKALDKQAEATAGAGAAAEKAEKQLAGFDEMNKLTDTSSSSSGGGGGGISDADLGLLDIELSEKLQSQIEWLAAHFKDILWYAGAIGAALATWKILSPFISDLGTVLEIAGAVAGIVVYIKGFTDAWENGLDLQNLSEMAGGAVAAMVLLTAALGPVAGAIAAIVGGVGLLVVGFKEFIETGELTHESCAAISTGLMLIGAAISLLTGSWIPLVVAAVIGAVLTVISYWEEIKAAWDFVISWIREKWDEFIEWLTGIFENINKSIGEFLDNAEKSVEEFRENVVRKFQELKASVVNFIQEMKQKAVEKLQELKEKAVQKITEIKQKAANIFPSISDVISTAVSNAREKFDELKEKAIEVWEIIKSKFTSIGTVIGSAISGAIKTAINGVLSKIQSTINSAIGIINGAIKVINLLPGVSASYVSTISLPRLARGGIVNNPGMGVPAIIGEAGKEAVLPLDRNTEWMDTLAEKLAAKSGASGQVVIPVYLSGKKIAEYIVDLSKRRAFATNNA